MTKAFLTAFLLTFAIHADAQSSNPFMEDANGRPLYLQTTYRSEGSPYFSDLYSMAEVTAIGGKVYHGIQVKLNLQTNDLLFMAGEEQEFVAVLPVSRLKFKGFFDGKHISDVILESYGQPLNSPNAPIFQVLDSGRCSLLKQLKVSFRDNKEFNQSTITRIFKRTESYHVLMPDKTVRLLQSGKEAILGILNDKRPQISAFIEKNRLKCRQEADYHKIIACYNTLFQ